ncbi:hypothetical protein SAMN05421819_1086 [Bryocella elongata]|uniref:Glycosyltransferase RgtA/B/C/D-like domain-containing protein n=1 Tax=Bryocella elongata TaxID=863522 RepID=A0A1H5ULS9_9BACT|nr:hypothetical protein [Bryocella elongata]SEF76012.1 hypothetical protein SAMN05421819_1086 [Bryocella elongata]
MNTGHPGRNLTLTLMALVVGAAMMTALLALVPAAGHDQLWFLLMAKRWLGGARLYGPEVFDSNPPMVVWLSAIPVQLSELLPVATTLVAKLLVILLDLVVAILALRALEVSVKKTSWNARLWLAFGFIVIFGAAEARDFGQRDALTALLLLPYVLMAAAWLPGKSAGKKFWALRVCAVLLATLGVCLKVQLAVVPLVVEAVLLLRSLRRAGARAAWLLRPEPWLLVASGAGYVYAIRSLTPLYFTHSLPLNLLTYWAIGHLTPVELFVEAVEMHVLLAMALGSVRLEHKRQARFAPAITMLTVAGLAATVAYYVQGTGWYYQQLPAISFFAGAVVLQLLGLAERLQAARHGRVAARGAIEVRADVPAAFPVGAAALVLLAGVLTIHFAGFGFTRSGFNAGHTFQITQPDPSFFAKLAPGTPVAILTTSVDDAMMPVERYQLEWAQHMNNLWLLPALLRVSYPQPGDWPVPKRHQMNDAQREQLYLEITSSEAFDLNRWKPQVVLVARCHDSELHCQVLEDRHDSLISFLLTSEQFADEWRHYHYTRSIGLYDEYVRQF